MRWLLLAPAWLLAGCLSPEAQIAALEELALGPCEIGELVLTGDVALSAAPWVSSSVHVDTRQERTFEMLSYECFEGTPLENTNDQ